MRSANHLFSKHSIRPLPASLSKTTAVGGDLAHRGIAGRPGSRSAVNQLGMVAFLFLSLAHPAESQTARKVSSLSETAANPIADARAEVVYGHARFTVLTSQLIRMEWAPKDAFEEHASLVFINRRLPIPRFERELKNGTLVIRTGELVLRYSPAGSDGRFTQENLSIELSLNGRQVSWHPGMADTGNLLGTARTLDDTRGLLTPIAMEPGLISIDGWTIVDDSTRPLFDHADFSFLDGEKSPWPWVMLRPSGERQDWYFFGYGHNYRQALYDYVRVAGRIPIPPRFAFGIWWSRYWAYSDQELERLVRGFRENDTPLDVLVIDMDWHPTFGTNFDVLDQSGHVKGWSGYSWNRVLFPDPGGFLKSIHEQGVRVTLNVHPASGVQSWEDPYVAMAKASGIDPATKQYVPFDISDKTFATNYMDLLHHPLERQGIDFWWLDWQQEDKTKMPEVNPTWWLAYVHFTDQQREGKRPLLLNRWGGLGTHRYQIGFSGDAVSVWDSLAFQPWFTATAANVGYAYWSHDIGGHIPGAVGPELYTRWVQFGCFSPILRTHTTKNPDSERRIWAYPEPYSGIMRDAFQLRRAFQPYLYTEARRTYDTGLAFVRPLYYDWPEAKESYQTRGEYNFGDSLIIAPITSPVDGDSQLAAKQVWLPQGEWIEWPTGRYIHGPATLEGRFSMQQVPVYAKAGAIIPMQSPANGFGEKPLEPLQLTIFPMDDGQRSTYTLYEDSGESEEYKRGVSALTRVEATRTGDDLDIVIGPTRGRYPRMPEERSYELRFPADWPPDSVTANGSSIASAPRKGHVGWRYEGNTLTTTVRVAVQSTASTLHIRVHRAAGLEAKRADLDGFAGMMMRLREANNTLNSLWPLVWAPDSLIDAMQSGDRLSYYPQNAQSVLQHFRSSYQEALSSVRRIADRTSVSDADLIARLQKAGVDTSHPQESVTRYRIYVQRALTQITSAQNGREMQ
jgi:alpha-glucosidase (family GH31 glycosyl hydrolase)